MAGLDGEHYEERSRRLYRNRAHQGAYRKGVRAFAYGYGVYDNPYKWKGKTAAKNNTWTSGYYKAWDAGWNDSAEGKAVGLHSITTIRRDERLRAEACS